MYVFEVLVKEKKFNMEASTTEEFLHSLMTSDSDFMIAKFFTLSGQDRRFALTAALRQFHCEITFTKVDGTIRTMPCTLKTQSLPPVPVKDITESREVEKPKRQQNHSLISVWCLDKKEWRSFRVMNVISIKRMEYSVE